MIPTLEIGDFIVVNKYAYGIRLPVIGTKIIPVDDPANGDVMVFIPPHNPDEYFIKRVIGVPGDRVRYADKRLYINDVEQPQRFVARIPPANPRYVLFEETLGGDTHIIRTSVQPARPPGEWVVPEGHYFVMGDNRDESADSRYWGFVPDEDIVGKAFAIWMHKDPGFNLPEFSRNGWIR
jgi:signal peptidase I